MIRNQQGAALLLLLVILFVLGLSLLISTLNSDQRRINETHKTQYELIEAKQLLIAYAAQGVIKIGVTKDYKPVRMGELPCPDFDANYVTNPPNDSVGSNCRQRLGWLPWRSLDAQIKSGQFNSDIWYAVDDMVYNRGGVIGETTEPILNRDSVVTLRLNGERMAAILFASGIPLSGQNQRNLNNANNAKSSFLEQENADGDDIYVNKISSDVFNDRALGISLSEIMDIVEVIAANILVERLNLYFTGTDTQVGNLAYPHLANASRECDASIVSGITRVPEICPNIVAAAISLTMPSNLDDEDMAWWVSKNQWFDYFSYQRVSANEVVIRATHSQSKMKPITLKNGVRL